MKKTNDNNTEEKLDEQSPISAIELLKDSIGYNEFVKFYESFSEKKNKSIEKKIAAIVSIGTLFFWLCKAIYFSYLSGVNFYYGISNEYIHINDNLGYQIFQYITGVLVVGIITIVFISIWIARTSIIKKIAKSIGMALLEMLIVFVWVCLYTYGFQPLKIISEIMNYSGFEKISLAVMLIWMWLAVHYYGIVILFSNRTTKKHKTFGGDKGKNKNVHKKKERKPLLKSNIARMVVLSAFFAVGAWIYGGINEMLRTEYNIIVCSSFDEENTDEEYIFEDDDKRYVAYMVICDTNDYFLCKRLTNEYTIKSNGQSFIKKEGIEVIKVREHFNKN